MTEEGKNQIYAPKNNELQLTVRAVLVGCLVGSVVTCMNLYIALKIGWSFGGSIIASIVGYSLFKVLNLRSPYTLLENNITQTAGSAAGSMSSAAGLLAPIPALALLGFDIPLEGLFYWALATAFMGVMFAVPLRRQYVVIEKLRFPSGTATAHTINSLYASGDEALRKAKTLLYFSLAALVFSLIVHFVPEIEMPPIPGFLEETIIATLALWGFKIYFSPLMLAAGMLIGPRVGISLALGAIIGWTLGYFALDFGWATNPNPMALHDKTTDTWGARGWILWSGAALMASEALMSLILSSGSIIKSFISLGAIGKKSEQSDEEIPTSWWLIGLLIAATITTITAALYFGIPWELSAIAIMVSLLLANVAVRCMGETDINPVGGVGKVTQLIFGTLSQSISTNLLSAGITGAGASQAADMMNDLKTGHMVGASPKKQFIAQLFGIFAGILTAVPMYWLFDQAWDIGGEDSPLGAPAAHSWKAVAQVVTQGLDALPPMSKTACLIAVIAGSSFALLRKFAKSISDFIPSGIAMGIAFMVPGYYSITMFCGAMLFLVWRRYNKVSADRLVFVVASGILVGEGVGGIVKAVLLIIQDRLS